MFEIAETIRGGSSVSTELAKKLQRGAKGPAGQLEGVELGSGFRQLDQDPRGGLGVQEGDALSMGPDPRYLIHQPVAVVASPLEGRIQVGDLVADVVDARAAALEEARDGTVGSGRFEQFHDRTAEGQ